MGVTSPGEYSKQQVPPPHPPPRSPLSPRDLQAILGYMVSQDRAGRAPHPTLPHPSLPPSCLGWTSRQPCSPGSQSSSDPKRPERPLRDFTLRTLDFWSWGDNSEGQRGGGGNADIFWVCYSHHRRLTQVELAVQAPRLGSRPPLLISRPSHLEEALCTLSCSP